MLEKALYAGGYGGGQGGGQGGYGSEEEDGQLASGDWEHVNKTWNRQ